MTISKMNYAFAMLAPGAAAAKSSPAAKHAGLGVLAAVSAGAMALAPAAHAGTIYGVWADSFDGFNDAFEIQTPPAFAQSGDVGYFLTNDALGFDGIEFSNGGPYTEVGIGVISNPSPSKIDYFTSPTPYDGNAAGALTLGVYTGGAFGSVLSLSAVPEPDAWALMIAGVALTGAALRGARRRRQSAPDMA